MKILIIEDDPVKLSDIENLLKKNKVDEIYISKSFNSAKRELRARSFDMILLDMSLPVFDDVEDTEDFETFGGIGILNEIKRIGTLNRVVVITAFDTLGEGKNQTSLRDLDISMKKDYSNIYIGLIHYDATSNQWQQKVEKLLHRYKEVNWNE